ncbi:MAG: L-glutamate gamma-semialdehyde dehydrogenase [Firmicutes bacterium]|jgi:1-pyrroline-5-carboxylate dehydrogenase|nr:L-glutamate gamma-semialdehyde dehydrogenase [Candidatus Fermentithermobacillaceae bacterium]
MANASIKVERPANEPVLAYAPGTPEREAVKSVLKSMSESTIEIPLIIGGKEVRTGRTAKCVMPHKHHHVLATYHLAGEEEVRAAIQAALKAKEEWENTPWEHRMFVFRKASELLSGPWRATLNAATMLGQSKTVYQAEIDSACELSDFFRFNCYYASEIYAEQPSSTRDAYNRNEYRPLEGFIFAVTPFNFTAIAGNLASAPALMGNTVVWKPASSAVYSAYHLMQLYKAAGLPDGVINFIPGPGKLVGDVVMASPDLAGVHFTGSTETFQTLWTTVGANIRNYKSYPRLVGETGGKDFVFAHPSADVPSLATALVRGAFEYQGQKCSAASRAYIPASLWPRLKSLMLEMISEIKVGDIRDFTNFMSAVIDKAAFQNIKGYLDYARAASDAEIICGGTADDSEGYFVHPTVILTKNPHFKTMEEEIFGPVLTVYVYEDKDLDEALRLCESTSPYGLTGSIFAQDRHAIVKMERALRHAAGNFYINDKPTGAVVGQQPFGGSRASGTNDKAGSKLNLLRWVSPRTIKETFNPPVDYRYPHMLEA